MANEENKATFDVDGESYEVGFNMKRIEMYESGHKPLMASFAQNGGTFSVAELKALCAYGLKKEGGAYVNPKKGQEMAEGLIEANGYFEVYGAVTEALERDCGFFFKVTE